MAICCIISSLSPSASGKTASGLPANGRSLNTSTWIMRRLFTVPVSFLACEHDGDLVDPDRAGAYHAKAPAGLQTAEIDHG